MKDTPTSSSHLRADIETVVTHIIEARVIGKRATSGRSTPGATDRPYLTVHEVLRAGRRRAAGRKDMAAAQSTWDSEGEATKRGSSDEKFGALLWC
jgi:hypothetical protein